MTDVATGTFTPRAGRAPLGRMLFAQAGFELRLLLRNGEQLLLALVIPIVALIGLNTLTLIELPAPRIATVLAGVWALAILSAGFTSLAIATAFDRRYAVTKRLIGSGVPYRVLLAGKATATAVVVAGQLVVLGGVAALSGWRPQGNPVAVLVVVLLGFAAFTGLGLLLGGTLKAEVVLALANLIWLAMVAIGGVVAPLSTGPAWLDAVGRLTPAGALSSALRTVLVDNLAPSIGSLAILAGWAVAGWIATLRWFKWQ